MIRQKTGMSRKTLIANSENELIEKVTAHFNGSGPLAVRYTFDLDIDDDFLTSVTNELIKHKVDLTNTNIGSTMNYFIIRLSRKEKASSAFSFYRSTVVYN